MKIYVGHDSREDIAYQVCEHSIKRRDPSAEVIPLKQRQMREQERVQDVRLGNSYFSILLRRKYGSTAYEC